jgi:choline dehydrogenase-like flavoprotein
MAERLYGVRGSPDPLRDDAPPCHLDAPPALSPVGLELADFLTRRGLHPYRLPLACDYVDGCRGCQGYLCAVSCKHDSATTCLLPALNEHGATLIDECEALRLETRGDKVMGVACRWNASEVLLRGNIVVLAAGALATPALLLRSASSRQPRGLANGSGLVGKNLMRHFVDLYALLPKDRQPFTGNTKELACSDFYVTPRGKFGSVQSFGAMPPATMMLEASERNLRDALRPRAAAALRVASPWLEWLLGRVLSRAVVLATVMEDLPHADNEVVLANGNSTDIAIRYRIDKDAERRIHEFRRLMRSVLGPYRFLLIKQAENNQRLAHVCGTCRFGADPRSSVLDSNNKAHDLANLYVVDASFFPSSGGTNPALTIAANALRVADHLIRLRDSKGGA